MIKIYIFQNTFNIFDKLLRNRQILIFITFAYLEYNCFYFLHPLQLDTLPIRQQDRISTAFSRDVALLPYTVLVCWPYSIYNQKHNKIQNENVNIYIYKEKNNDNQYHAEFKDSSII